jgi:hypothetical protein
MTKKYKNGPPYLSYTGFSKYESCPQSYYLEYIKREKPDVEDSRNSFTGNALHKLLEDYIGNGDDNPEWLKKNAVDYWESERDNADLIVWRHAADADDLLDKMVRWSSSLAELVVQANIKPHQWQSELKVDSNVKLKGSVYRMGGRIDLMRKKDNGDVLFFDLKGSENKSIMKLDQITWYATLLGVYLGDMDQPVAGGYLLPGFNEIKMFKVPEAKKLDLLNRVYAAFQGIKNKEWEPKPEGSRCFWCPVKHACVLHGGAFERKNGIIDLGGIL